MAIENVTGNILAEVEYDGANLACINTTEGTVLIDTPMLRRNILEWKGFVESLNPKGIQYILNTHIHFDHVIGNNLIGGIVVTHENGCQNLFKDGATLRETMVGFMPGWSKEDKDFVLSEPLVEPEICLQEKLTLYQGEYTIECVHVGGHTPDSIIVYVVEEQVLITGDNLTAALHPYKGEACFSDWLKALKKMKTYDIKAIIPGHGEVCRKDMIDRFIDYFQSQWDITSDLINKGLSQEEVVQKVHQDLFSFFEVEQEMLQAAKMMFDLGTSQLFNEIKSVR